jgi:hypothetical protein
VLRHHALRRDGTVRDTVMYSITAGEWPEIKAHLRYKLAQHEPSDMLIDFSSRCGTPRSRSPSRNS